MGKLQVASMKTTNMTNVQHRINSNHKHLSQLKALNGVPRTIGDKTGSQNPVLYLFVPDKNNYSGWVTAIQIIKYPGIKGRIQVINATSPFLLILLFSQVNDVYNKGFFVRLLAQSPI